MSGVNIMPNGYSKGEILLIRSFGYENLIGLISPPQLYRACVEFAFRENLQGPNVEALRRASIALANDAAHRNTIEFEELIRF